jgi:hypothetical protein
MTAEIKDVEAEGGGGLNWDTRVFAGVPLVDSQGGGWDGNLHLSWYGSP